LAGCGIGIILKAGFGIKAKKGTRCGMFLQTGAGFHEFN